MFDYLLTGISAKRRKNTTGDALTGGCNLNKFGENSTFWQSLRAPPVPFAMLEGIWFDSALLYHLYSSAHSPAAEVGCFRL